MRQLLDLPERAAGGELGCEVARPKRAALALGDGGLVPDLDLDRALDGEAGAVDAAGDVLGAQRVPRVLEAAVPVDALRDDAIVGGADGDGGGEVARLAGDRGELDGEDLGHLDVVVELEHLDGVVVALGVGAVRERGGEGDLAVAATVRGARHVALGVEEVRGVGLPGDGGAVLALARQVEVELDGAEVAKVELFHIELDQALVVHWVPPEDGCLAYSRPVYVGAAAPCIIAFVETRWYMMEQIEGLFSRLY